MSQKTSHFNLSRRVAWLLLAIFGTISVMGEGLHLLPGLGECCHKLQISGCACSHPPVSDISEHDDDSCTDTPADFCLVCHFFSLYRCESGSVTPADSPTVISFLEDLVPTLVFTELFYRDHARAPPVVCVL